MAEMDVKTLIQRLQRMHGHVGARDKTTIVAAIGALTDLSVQLFSATHLNYQQNPKKGTFELKRVEEDTDGAAALPLP